MGCCEAKQGNIDLEFTNFDRTDVKACEKLRRQSGESNASTENSNQKDSMSSDILAANQETSLNRKTSLQMNEVQLESDEETSSPKLWESTPSLGNEENQSSSYNQFKVNTEDSKNEENLNKSWNLPRKMHRRVRFGPLATIKEEQSQKGHTDYQSQISKRDINLEFSSQGI